VADEALHGDDDQSLMVLDELLVTRSGVRAPHLARAGTEPGVGAGAPSRIRRSVTPARSPTWM
jgi:hypothetical protein